MNYSFRTGVPKAKGGYVIDYSHDALATLHEKALDEANGIGGSSAFKTVWTNGLGKVDTARADQRLDWDGVDSDHNGTSDDDAGVPVDTNLLDGTDPNVPAQTC